MLQLTGELFTNVLLTYAGTPAKDDDLLLDTSATNALGEISIHMQSIASTIQSSHQLYKKPPGELQLHERSKKLTSHHIKCVWN
jgi:hypothetical protein